jgi:cell envelope opacity-associated protein A
VRPSARPARTAPGALGEGVIHLDVEADQAPALPAQQAVVAVKRRLMRHNRLATTEQYMAYAPQPDLARRVTMALEPSRAVTAFEPLAADRFDPKQLPVAA